MDVLREVRAAIEGIVAEEAAQSRTGRDLLKMHAAIEAQEESRGDKQTWVIADRVFHETVLQAAHNPALAVFGSVIVDCFASLDVPEKVCMGTLAGDILADHWLILKYIKEKKGSDARSLMCKHINSTV